VVLVFLMFWMMCGLIWDVGKGAKTRKKKALVDMLRALQAVGLSRHRSAVPPRDREVAAWFQTPLPQEGGHTDVERQLTQWALGQLPTPSPPPFAHRTCS
jgi:hypothetical protein